MRNFFPEVDKFLKRTDARDRKDSCASHEYVARVGCGRITTSTSSKRSAHYQNCTVVRSCFDTADTMVFDSASCTTSQWEWHWNIITIMIKQTAVSSVNTISRTLIYFKDMRRKPARYRSCLMGRMSPMMTIIFIFRFPSVVWFGIGIHDVCLQMRPHSARLCAHW